MLRRNKKGFTLIELLVVIAIIGLLSTLAMVALNSARAKSRDAKRISDMKQIQTALELFFADQNSYPTAAAALVLGGSTATALCSDAATGFKAAPCTGTTYMGSVPKNQTPNGTDYTYAITTGPTYSITFTLEGPTGNLASGIRTATQNGIQ